MKNCVPTSKLRHLRKSDEGQALVLTALALVILMLMAGLGVDVGYFRYQKQQMQKAADAGAIAGASAYIYSTNWKLAAKNDASANGFTDGTNGIVVKVDKPWEGPFAGLDGYVEVSVSQAQPRFFMRVLSSDTVPVRSWAVANANGSASGCIYALDPSARSSFKAQGTIRLTSQCGIRVNSSNVSAAYTDGGGACVVTVNNGIGVVGGVEGGSVPSCSTIPQTRMAPFSDPFAALVAPSVGVSQGNCTTGGDGITRCTPGRYNGGITVTGGADYVFQPGLYILFGGGLQIHSGATVSGTGVTFYNTGNGGGGQTGFKAISIDGASTVNLSAPTNSSDPTHALEGILFFEDRNPSGGGTINNTINGGSSSTFDGALYFFSSSLNYSGNSSPGGYSIIVANEISITGNSNFYDDYSSLADGPPIKAAVATE